MSTLIVLLPSSDSFGSDNWAATPMPFALLDRKGGTQRTGRAALEALPHADTTVLVVAARDTLLLNVKLPPVTGPRLRRALPNVVEEHLIQDAQRCHVAIDPVPLDSGERCVAVIDREWFASVLDRFGEAGHRRLRAVPLIRCIPLSDVRLPPQISQTLASASASSPAAGSKQSGEVAARDTMPVGSAHIEPLATRADDIRAIEGDAGSEDDADATTTVTEASTEDVSVEATVAATSALIVRRSLPVAARARGEADDLQAVADSLADGGRSHTAQGSDARHDSNARIDSRIGTRAQARTEAQSTPPTDDTEWVELALRQGALGFGISVNAAQLDTTLAELAQRDTLTIHALAVDAPLEPGSLLQAITPLPWPHVAQAAADCRFNLCQFEFANAGQGRAGAGGFKPWRIAIGFVIATAAVSIVAVNVQWYQLRARRDALNTQMIEAVKTAFPTTTVILDPHAQMNSGLARMRTAIGELRTDDFLALAAGLSHALGPISSVSIAELNYSGATLDVTFKPGTDVDGSGLKTRLAANGLSAEEDDGKWMVKPVPSRPR